MKLFVREAADADLEEIAACIGQDSAAAAASILKSVRAAFEAVATPPKAWTTPLFKDRRLKMHGFFLFPGIGTT